MKNKKLVVIRKTITVQPLNLQVIIGKGTVTITKERPATKDERTKPGELMAHTVNIDFTGKRPVVTTDSVVY
jgi:hypothetical protein